MTRQALVVLLLALLASACSADGESAPPLPEATLTVYSGSQEEVLRPVVEQFEYESGIDVDIRSGPPVELAQTIVEEGAASPVDVYHGPGVGGLDALASADRLQPLPPEVLERVDPRFRGLGGRWVGVSGQARVAAYHTGVLDEDSLPASVLDLAAARWAGGRVGWAPTDRSFQTFVTALRLSLGEDGARAWLESMVANQVRAFPDDAAVVAAVAAGDIALGLVDHDAVQHLRQATPDAPVANHLFADIGSLVTTMGAGVVDTSDDPGNAQRFVEFLLTEPVQGYIASEARELPLVPGVPSHPAVPPLASLPPAAADLNRLTDLEGTLDVLRAVGVI